MAWTSTRRVPSAVCVAFFSDASCSRLRATVGIIGHESLHRDLASRLLAPFGRVRCILSEPPNNQSSGVAQDSDLRSGSDRSRPLSIRLETGTKMCSPMRHTLHPLGRVHATQAWSAHTSTHEHWHIHCSSRTPRSLAYTQHPDRASTHIAIAFTRHPTVTTPTTIQLTPPKHTSRTHEQSEGRQKACAVVPFLSDALADCATVATPFLGGKICHVHRPPRCGHASV